MKKLLLMIAAVAALSFTACDNAAQNDNAAANTDSVPAFAVEQFDQALAAATDSAGVDSLITTANAEVQRLIEAGDNEGAANLLAQVKEIVAKNADKIYLATDMNTNWAGRIKHEESAYKNFRFGATLRFLYSSIS